MSAVDASVATSGSVTQVPVLTMPAGDITHPVPDLTGYITEGQIVLTPDVHGEGIYPPVDVLGSLSRLMRKGTGQGRTRADHPGIAAQLVAAVACARQVRDLAELIGAGALTATDRSYLAFADAFNAVLVDQRVDEQRHWRRHSNVHGVWRLSFRAELTMVSTADIDTYYEETAGGQSAPPVDGASTDDGGDGGGVAGAGGVSGEGDA